MYTRICVATDGSQSAGVALQTAIELALERGASLTVFHVLMHGEPPEALRHMAEVEHLITNAPPVRPDMENVHGQLQEVLAERQRHHFDHAVIAAIGDNIVRQAKEAARDQGLATVRCEVLEGDVVEQITAAARRIDAELVVMGSRGLSPLKSLLMGSVSQKVSQRVDCSCLIVK